MFGRLGRLAAAPLIAGLTLAADSARRAARALGAEAPAAGGDEQRLPLRDQIKLANDLFDSVPLALAMRDPGGRYLFVNRTWERYFSARREDVVGRHVRDRMTPAEADALLALDRAALERGSGTTQTEDFQFRGRHLMQTRTVMADPAGEPLGVLVATLETTEQHATNERLREQMALTRAIVAQIPNAIFTKDAAGRFTMVNPGWSEMSGVPAERAVGKTVHDIYAPEMAQRMAEEDASLIAQGPSAQPTEAEHSGPRPGQWRIVKKAVLSRDDGTVLGLVATSTDISEMKRVQAELAERAKFEADLVDALPISVALRDTDCRFVQVNRMWERYFGIRREDAIGKRFSELPGWRDNPELVRVAGEAEAVDRDLIARGPAAPPMLFEDTRLGRSYLLGRQLFTDSAGRITGLLATGVDTTELREAQRALATERERLALLVRSTRAGFSEWHAGTDTMSYSDRFKEMLGHGADVDTSAWRIFELMHPDDAGAVRAKFLAMIQPRTGVRAHEPAEALEYRLRRADGGYLWVRAEGLVERDDAGRARRFITSYIDITALREQERSLRDQMVLTSSLFEHNPNAMYVKDMEGRYVTVNGAWERMLGVPRSRAIGRTMLELFAPEPERDRNHAEDLRLIREGEGSSELASMRTGPDGRPQWLIVRKAVLRNARGEVIGLIGTNTDITRLKQYEAELAERAKFVSELVDAMPISVAMRDVEGRYMLVNRAWERYFGVQRDDALGRRRRELPGWQGDEARLADADEIERLDRDMLARGPDYMPEPQETLRLGRYYLMTRRALFDSAGRALGVVSAGIDMTERRAMEERLRDQMELTRALIDENPNAMYLKDAQGRYVQVNDAWLRMVGVTRERAIGRNVLELFPEKESERYHAEDMRLLAEREGFSEMESLRTGPGGEPQWVIIRKTVLRRANGEVIGLIGANTDITELKRYEQALAAERRQLDLVVRASRAGIVDWDGFTHATYYSPRFREILGHAPDADTSGWPDYFKVLLHPDDRARFTQRWQAFIKGKGAEGARGQFLGPDEHRLLRKDGSYVWVEVNGIAVRNDKGFVTRWIAATTDITERRAMEESLLTERQRLELVVSAAKAGIIDWEPASETPWFSARFKEMLGYPPNADSGALGGMFGALVHPEDRDRSREVFMLGLVSRGAPNSVQVQEPLELRLRRADGTWLWVQSMGLTLRDEAGEAKRYLAAVTDVTQRRAHEEALKETVRLREEVERMSRHDLKTPLNSVIAVSRLLREGGKLVREDEELLSIVERAGYRILSMVNLSLDLFRMEQGTYQFRPQAVDMMEVVRKVAADLEGQAASKGVGIKLRQSGSSLARAEELLSYSMLANIVKNAIEAEPEGGVVSLTVEGAGPRVSVHVHNSGVVPEAVRARFFQKYATAGKSAGLGLGTYSALLMARVQEGDITLHSVEHEGTTVSVRLRAMQAGTAAEDRVPAATATSAERLPELPPLRVLVVDDDEFNRLVLRRYLPTPPITLRMAVNGRAALDAARADWPDAVLLDLEMPVMDGYEAAARLREMERDGRPRCKIIAISSNDEERIVQRALDAGCDDYLVKPAARETLWALLAGARPSAARQTPEAPAGERDPVELDADLESRLDEFLRSRRELIDAMAPALQAGDRVHFRRLAHKLAGSFALYGFRWASAQCRALESAAMEGHPGELARHVAAVRTHLETATIRIRQPTGRVAS